MLRVPDLGRRLAPRRESFGACENPRGGAASAFRYGRRGHGLEVPGFRPGGVGFSSRRRPSCRSRRLEGCHRAGRRGRAFPDHRWQRHSVTLGGRDRRTPGACFAGNACRVLIPPCGRGGKCDRSGDSETCAGGDRPWLRPRLRYRGPDGDRGRRDGRRRGLQSSASDRTRRHSMPTNEESPQARPAGFRDATLPSQSDQ